jgi:hypothetical protein
MTDGGPEPHLEDKGLWIPERFREFTGQVVFRTPRSTIQHFGSSLDAFYGMIDASHFGDSADTGIGNPQNPELAPNKVSIKLQGEDAEVFELDLEDGQELIADGGQTILQEAQETVGARDDTHGDPVQNHEHIARLWTAFLEPKLADGETIAPAEVADMMIQVKQSRAMVGGVDRDHRIDIAGYAHIAQLCEHDALSMDLPAGTSDSNTRSAKDINISGGDD